MRTRFLGIYIVAALLATVGLSTHAHADSVFKWQDDDGLVHYSTKPPHKGAEPVALPRITRGEVKLTTRKLISCKEHGEINCQAGPDSDGSVICYDGFRGASPLFRFSCTAPKLEISDISNLDDKGGFTVFVRNAKSVAASKPAVLFKPDSGQEVKLEGPENIDAFGVAEFIYKAKTSGEMKDKPTLAQLNLTCANCP